MRPLNGSFSAEVASNGPSPRADARGLAAQQVIGRTYEPLPVYVLAALMYFAINYSLSMASRRLESRFAYVRE